MKKNSNIELVDSTEFHKNKKEETKHQLRQFSKFLLSVTKSKIFYIIVTWVIFFKISNYYSLGFIQVIITGVVLIFTNLGKRKEGEISAYSIFNKNQEKILGTFETSQIEQQLTNQNTHENVYRNKLKEDIAKSMREEEEFEKDRRNFASIPLSKKSNMKCICGSGRKYKKCCYWRELKEQQQEEKEESQRKYK